MPRARETRPRDGGTEQYAGLEQAAAKLRELLNCGNERVELSAAKEILAMAETEAAKRAGNRRAPCGWRWRSGLRNDTVQNRGAVLWRI